MSYWMAVRRRLAEAALAAVDVSALAIAYTGNMTDEIVTMGDGNQYRLLTLISSGTLSIPAEVKADVWLCGGGARGGGTPSDTATHGGGGGYVNSAYNQSIQNTVATVGAASGASSFGGITANGATGANGGSGGGQGGYPWNSPKGTGAGVTTYPFGDTTYFAGKPHCAGGSGGSYESDDGGDYNRAGSGGSNGSDGSGTQYQVAPTQVPGGLLGGGYGGKTINGYSWDGGNASFYGSGGGGRGLNWKDSFANNGGNGYQGVIYMRIPLKQ